MKLETINAVQIWKQMEDVLVPRLRLSVLDRSIYSHLLRHSRLEAKPRLRFSIQWLARAVRVSGGPVREAVRRLAALGVLRLVERTKAGHLVEVRLPGEVPAACSGRASVSARRASPVPAAPAPPFDLERADFLQTRALRQSIHSRERGLCFYCLRRTTPSRRCLDHVVPRVQFGRNSYRNLVSCCVECNSQKSERLARDFLRWLYREQRLTTAELAGRLRALDDLAAGKLRPLLAASLEASALPPAVPSKPAGSHPASRKRLRRTSFSLPEFPTQRVSPPPGGPANPFPRKGRPCKTPASGPA
jgi:hypothetical protein